MSNKKPKVLIVDDLATNIQVVMNLLQKENFELFFAMDYKEAFYLIENEIFDLILLDIMMPEMDGFEICKVLKSKESTKEIPIIFLTAKTEPQDIVKGFEVGAVDYITKPFNQIELLARVKTQLSLKEAREEREKILKTEATLKAKSEMINVVAHQWRQPLNTLALIIQDLEFNCQQDKSEIDSKHIEYQVDKGMRLITHLSEIITEFSDFFTPKMNKEIVSISNIINEIIIITQKEFDSLNINVERELNANDKIYTYKREFIKVLLNIVNNAKDVLSDKANSRKIKIVTSENSNSLIVEIIDNGGGVTEDVIDKIFEPYFSTKSLNGTGLGLYISKVITTEYMGGQLKVQNIEIDNEKGAKFTLTLPL